MDKAELNTYLEQAATTIDFACVACWRKDTDEAGEIQREIIHDVLDGLGKVLDAEGEEGTKFANGLMSDCATCLTRDRNIPLLVGTKSCGIRRKAWRLAPRPNKAAT